MQPNTSIKPFQKLLVSQPILEWPSGQLLKWADPYKFDALVPLIYNQPVGRAVTRSSLEREV